MFGSTFVPGGSGGGASGNFRTQLTAARTYYVSTTGSDSNDGLTSGTAFATIQKAVDTASNLDNGIYDVTIQILNGSYTIGSQITLKNIVGAGKIIIQGDVSNMDNVVLNFSGSSGFSAQNIFGIYQVQYLKLVGSGHNAFYLAGVQFYFQNIDFGAGWNFHIQSQDAYVRFLGNYKISGGAGRHLSIIASYMDFNYSGAMTITLTGTPAFTSFIYASRAGVLDNHSSYLSISGGATGQKYIIETNSVIDTGGAGTSFFPGTIAGTSATGAQYV